MKTDNKAILAYLAVCFFWGSTYLAIKIGVHGFPPFVLAGFRHTIAGTIMLSATLLLKKSFPKDKKDILLNILVGLLMLAGANGLVTLAEQWVDSGITSLLVSLVPVYIVIIQWIVLKTIKVSWQGIIGIGLGFFGVYLLVNPSATIQIIDPLGVTILLFGCFLWSLGSLVSTLIKSKETLNYPLQRRPQSACSPAPSQRGRYRKYRNKSTATRIMFIAYKAMIQSHEYNAL